MQAAMCVEDIEEADFVAIRLDVSAAPDSRSESAEKKATSGSFCSAEAHYRSCLNGLSDSEPLPNRLGICCARWCAQDGLWQLRAHEIGLWPGGELLVSNAVTARRRRIRRATAASAAVAFARQAADSVGEAKSACSQDGEEKIRTSRQQSEKCEKAAFANAGKSHWAAQLASSVRWVTAALQSAKVPILVHGGISELLQIHDKFIGPPPSSQAVFGAHWLEFCPLVFDTCLMMQEGQTALAAMSLEQSHRESWLNYPAGVQLPFRELGVFTRRASATRLGLVADAGEGFVAREAMAIAETFLMQMAKLGGVTGRNSMATPTGSKRRKGMDGTPVKQAMPTGQNEEPVPNDANPDGSLPHSPKKRMRPSTEKAAFCAEALGAIAEKLSMSGLLSWEVNERLETCRRFQNRVIAHGTANGSLSLDALIQAKLVRHLKQTGCSRVLRLARILWAAASPPSADSSRVSQAPHSSATEPITVEDFEAGQHSPQPLTPQRAPRCVHDGPTPLKCAALARGDDLKQRSNAFDKLMDEAWRSCSAKQPQSDGGSS
eukprot:TRINITY_DN24766_c0_g1_i1.p1 TRINITY_DN24766_c0_g1~~TRINITY_DN24766_c0_g1_i1.p1  ORF type:complete len:586 (-),score=70.26 TRINITY_DN24766_c0_g1_i1:385-2028(-)